MKRLALLVPLVWVACGCPSKPSTQGPGTGSGSGGPPPDRVVARTCDDVKPRVEKLYRVEAEAKEPKRIEEAIADNTAMVMADCAKNPAQFVPCLATVPTVAELEKKCILPLDDEGTEGER